MARQVADEAGRVRSQLEADCIWAFDGVIPEAQCHEGRCMAVELWDVESGYYVGEQCGGDPRDAGDLGGDGG